MNIYLVGGAVRDALLKRPIKEKDWVVVGSSPEAMVAQGYQPVGKEFPVFLHPTTKEEYALARTEKKVGKGYKGFTFYTSPEVTLEQDLLRRDLTINAIAQADNGDLIDPFNGRQDLTKQVLRHVSPAFSEDPVRILRLARFAAKLPDFTVDPGTLQLMQDMVAAGEADALVAERVWQECYKALHEIAPWRFFEVLEQCGAAKILWPQFILNPENLAAMKKAVKLNEKGTVRLAALWHQLEPEQTKTLAKRYKLPKEYSEFISIAVTSTVRRPTLELTAEKILSLLKTADAFRRPERFADFLTVRQAIAKDEEAAIKENRTLEKSLLTAKNVDMLPLHEQGLEGKAFADGLAELRLKAIASL